ncbi:inactive TPR repeat-containing thioredoxin TTL3 [Manihot esculenta]|uniref:Thioredoxin domain-containing protein n=1 Tax=Manihot esculenta TaxID=3983 RepID=A0A2C9WKJ4_MANES|nr:inactive TPR repeat-containing thioredoxin TTL3 [Manihot esculenta]OAY60714.1 hypothetical protein MANES_01G133400v8 [Manihot esculenta]
MSSYSQLPSQESINDSFTNRFRDSLTCSNSIKKLDFKELDLGSPLSPLIIPSSLNNSTASTPSTSIASSSCSVSTAKITTTSTQFPKKHENVTHNQSGELPGLSETSPARHSTLRSSNSHLGHRRSISAGAPLIYSGSSFGSTSNGSSCGNTNGASSVSTSSSSNLLHSGNICPSGKILKTALTCRVSNKTDTLGTGTANYGHGSIMRGGSGGGGSATKFGTGGHTGGCGDPEELKKTGNEMYRRGNFVEALGLYDKAILLAPENAAYRSNRAAALTAIGKLGEAVRECEEAVKLDPGYTRAHQRLASLYLRLGQAENARCHLLFHGQQPCPTELQKLHSLEKHIHRCADARKIGDWKAALRETDAALTIGADSSPQLIACKAEAFLKLHQLEDADTTISNMSKVEYYPPQTKFFGMVAEAYVLYVQAQIAMALGKFENAVSMAEKAGLIDYSNIDIAMVLTNFKMAARARKHGNDLFSSGKYAEASSAYGEGLRYDSSNPVLHCNRAVCWSKLGLWEKSIEDCTQALRIQPNYTKALFRRAASNEKLGRWAEAVKDYEVLRKELAGDNEFLESLQRAQTRLKKSLGEVHNTNFGGEVEELSSLDKFKAAISSPGVKIVHFKAASDEQSADVSPFLNMLCVRYPSIHFFKVDVEESLAVAKAEGIRTVPTFKVYKNGDKVKEMIRPSLQFLEDSVKSYST